MQALFCVFMYLDVFSLARAAQVCRTWNRLVQMPSLWRRVSLRNAIVSSKCLNHIAKYCTELSDFSLHGLRGKTRRREEDVAEYLRRTRGSLEEGLEAVMKVAGGSLKKLQVVDCGNLLTDRCLWLASCYSRNIIDVTYISDLDPVGSEVIWSLGAGCRQVSRLIIPPMFPNQNPHKFTNHCAFNIARCWPDLHTLSIGGVDVNSKGLTAIGNGRNEVVIGYLTYLLIRTAHFCGKLQRLELDHMCEITEEVAMAMCKAGLKGLRVLHLTFTPVTPKALLHFTSACPYLDDITVRVGISDYYEDTENPQHREEFATIISKLRKLQHRPGFEQKLRLNVDYGAQKLTMPAPLTRR
ncbi:hypothetical protein CAPTEDRAFT_177056 [Capitella teleta]|uniref:F-box domain-containing protein n=1 Tax=Capitella teleta TaxID=283909 RepID=R7UUG3_CAPTE|nr:hypothetical protein CAPTEDRAFT_177056 [Capitella teleta]|eukprot:ELU07026.1 hypothetical protein CAPTEDRAFT_177056 [Capitella teleta]